MKKITTILSMLAMGSILALAEDAAAPKPGDQPAGPGGHRRGGDPEAFFKKLDSDGDGFISLDEFKAGPMAQKDPAKAEERFKALDTNGDGKVSLEEFKAGHHGRGGHGDKAPDAGAPKA